jgi:hypothetical protein
MIQRNTQRTTPEPPKDPIVDDIKALWDAGRTLPGIAALLHLEDKVVRHVLQTGEMPNAASDLVDTIRTLHSICVSAAEISRRLRIDQATAIHAIEHGTLPARQLPLLWRDDSAVSL